jgi:hypothetical protein
MNEAQKTNLRDFTRPPFSYSEFILAARPASEVKQKRRPALRGESNAPRGH